MTEKQRVRSGDRGGVEREEEEGGEGGSRHRRKMQRIPMNSMQAHARPLHYGGQGINGTSMLSAGKGCS